ncbi:MAG TPA: hypothetical protein VN602_02320 [Gemmatimonadaceae bacterium]|nr:hypothetical protein [Gemmatimonadaceae bacterium]
MKKLLIPFIASFGLSLGIATGVVMVRTPKPVVSAKTDKVAAANQKPDSTRAAKDSIAATPADSTNAVGAVANAQTGNVNAAGPSGGSAPSGAPAGSGATAPPPAGHDVASAQDKAAGSGRPASANQAPNTKLASTAQSGGAAPKPVVRPIRPATDSLIGRRLAQVFGAMQPKDAARVLEQMDDNDVRAILGSLSSKQQAAILGSFPTQRAALILQATLRTASSGGTE